MLDPHLWVERFWILNHKDFYFHQSFCLLVCNKIIRFNRSVRSIRIFKMSEIVTASNKQPPKVFVCKFYWVLFWNIYTFSHLRVVIIFVKMNWKYNSNGKSKRYLKGILNMMLMVNPNQSFWLLSLTPTWMDVCILDMLLAWQKLSLLLDIKDYAERMPCGHLHSTARGCQSKLQRIN